MRPGTKDADGVQAVGVDTTSKQETPVMDAAHGTASVSDRLRALAGWLDQNPEIAPYSIEVPGEQLRVNVFNVRGRDHLADLMRTVGGRWDKHHNEEADLFHVTQEILPGVTLSLTVWRSEVCERVVVGHRTVEEPDPEQVAALPKVSRTVEVVEWRCGPVLAGVAA